MNVRPAFANHAPAAEPPPLAQIIAVMQDAHGRDLSLFDETFLTKSLLRRLEATTLANWPAYADGLMQDYAEAEALYQSLNIGYSEFFRDPLAFALLEQVILPRLAQQSGQAGLRVWSAGCAAGQEAWSIAILLEEQNAEREQPVPFRIFATDSVEALLAGASEGFYDAASVQQLRLKHLGKYFTVTGDRYRISPALKSRVDFPFSTCWRKVRPVRWRRSTAISTWFSAVICCSIIGRRCASASSTGLSAPCAPAAIA